MDIHISYDFKEFICLENCRIGETDFEKSDSTIFTVKELTVKPLKELLETLVSENILIEVN